MEPETSIESKSPHFFKVIFQETIQSKKLRIPSKFAALYCRDFMVKQHQMVILKVPGGEMWEVETQTIDDRLYLCKGWQEFVDFYGIKKNYFLVFKYKKKTKSFLFHVLIFDETATEIVYPIKLFNTSEEEENIHLEGDHPSEHESMPQFPHEFVNSNPPTKNTVQGGRNQNQRLKQAERDRALKRASSFKSRNPYFSVVMQPSYIYRPILNIPKRFFMEHMKNAGICSSDVGKLCLSDGSRSWTTKYLRTLYNNKEDCKITSGWKEFVKDNDLKLGDVCVFELLKSSLVAFRVTIFRAHGSGDGECSCTRCPDVDTSDSGGGPLKDRYYGPRIAQAEKEIALQRANRFTSRNPYFTLVMQPSYIHRFILNVPRKFFMEHMVKNDSNVLKLYVTSAGRSSYWIAKYNCAIVNNRTDCKVTSGWKAFTKDNNLTEGDVCVFELVKNVPMLTFQVTILRTTTQASPALHSHGHGSGSGPDISYIGKRKRCQYGMQKLVPSFQSTMTKTILWSSSLAVPLRVASKVFLGSSVEKTVHLKVGDRMWSVKALYYVDIKKCKITAGWTNFVRENSLEVGDTCKFELVDPRDMVMIVTIRRGRNY